MTRDESAIEGVDLLPCRKCGSNEGDTDNFSISFDRWVVQCGRCCFMTATYDTRAEAIAAWNQRTASDEDYKLPCDVKLPPVTTIRAGCSLTTLKLAMGLQGRPRHFPERVAPAPSDLREALEAIPALTERLCIANDPRFEIQPRARSAMVEARILIERLAAALTSPANLREEICPHCKGEGDIDNGDHSCFKCGGSGRILAHPGLCDTHDGGPNTNLRTALEWISDLIEMRDAKAVEQGNKIGKSAIPVPYSVCDAIRKAVTAPPAEGR